MARVGWYRPQKARKWHYFMKRRSLCSRYHLSTAAISLLHDDQHQSTFNCKACMRKRDRMFAVKEA